MVKRSKDEPSFLSLCVSWFTVSHLRERQREEKRQRRKRRVRKARKVRKVRKVRILRILRILRREGEGAR